MKQKETIENITPEMAEKYLQKNRINRNISMKLVKKYADDMKNGAWQDNGESIKFYESGWLADGQHRLMAIITAGITVKMRVKRGISDSVTVFDMGRGRTVTDSMIIAGMDKEIANATNVAIARLHYTIQAKVTSPSMHQTGAFLQKYEGVLRDMASIRTKGHDGGVTIRNAIFMLPMMYAIECGEPPEKIKEFANLLASGIPTGENQTPVFVIRRDIMSGKLPTKGGASDRKRSCFAMENAIYDFCRGKDRQKTYTNSPKQVYSNNKRFREAED